VELLGFSVRGTVGPGVSMRDQYRVECGGAVLEGARRLMKGKGSGGGVGWKLVEGCWVSRRLGYLRKQLFVSGGAGGSGNASSATYSKADTLVRSILAQTKWKEAVEQNFGGGRGGAILFDGLWFFDVPSELGRREIAGFLNALIGGRQLHNSFDFLNAPDFPRDIAADWKYRSKVFSGTSSSPTFRDHVVRLNISSLGLDAAWFEKVFKGTALGRECFVVPVVTSLSEGRDGMDMKELNEALEDGKYSNDVVVEDLDAVEENVLPAPPANVFELLNPGAVPGALSVEAGSVTPVQEEEDAEEEELDVSELADSANPAAAETMAAEAAKKKKKKKKPKSKAEEELEKKEVKIIEKIEEYVQGCCCYRSVSIMLKTCYFFTIRTNSPTKKAAPTNQCAHQGCKEKLNSLSMLCKFCNRKFCLTHRLPEVHSPQCAAAMKQTSQKSYKEDSKLQIGISKKDGKAGGVASLAKEREDAKKRLKEKMEQAARVKTGGGGTSSSSVKKKK
jgi:hypothetical protein